jgi:hypothetical protein
MFHKIEVEVGLFCLNKDTGVTGLISEALFYIIQFNISVGNLQGFL